MSEGTVVYKVVRISSNRKIRSAIVDGDACIEYRPNVWTPAKRWLAEKGYFITAFRSFEEARQFLEDNIVVLFMTDRYEIWRAEAKGVIENLPKRCSVRYLNKGFFVECSHLEQWPPGTIMVRSIKLIEPSLTA